MIIVMEPAASEGQIADVVERLAGAGARVRRIDGDRVTLAASVARNTIRDIDGLRGVAAILDDAAGTPSVAGPDAGRGNGATSATSAEPAPGATGQDDVVPRGFAVGDHWIGGDRPFVAAGPCSVEDHETMDQIAAAVADAGAQALRAGAYKPRSSPYSFQGMGEEGLAVARAAADAHGLLFVSEVTDAIQIPVASRYVDILQVGARNMANTSLLRELGRARRPVLLKRGLAATIDEWIAAAEYVASAGNPAVILCERGIRTFETATRNTLDLNAVPVARQRTRLPVLVDPSHGTGRRDLVPTMARAAMAAGADGLLLEAHVDPDRALSDAAQTIETGALRRIVEEAMAVRHAFAP